MSTKLAGEYQSTATGIRKNDLNLVIGTRKAPTPHKPKNYLLHKLPSGRCMYVSSLYPAPEATKEAEIYTFDYGGINYRLEVNTTAGTAHIDQL